MSTIPIEPSHDWAPNSTCSQRYLMARFVALIFIALFSLVQIASAESAEFEVKLGQKRIELFLGLPFDGYGRVINGSVKVDLKQNDATDYSSYVTAQLFVGASELKVCAGDFDSLAKRSSEASRKMVERWDIAVECKIVFAENDKFYSNHLVWNVGCSCFITLNSYYSPDGESIIKFLASGIVSHFSGELSRHYKYNVFDTVAGINDSKIPPNLQSFAGVLKAVEASEALRKREQEDSSKTYHNAFNAIKLARNKIEAEEKERAEEIEREFKLREAEEKRKSDERERVEKSLATASGRLQSNPNGIIFKIKNVAGKTVHIRFFNLGFSNRGPAKGVWPALGKAYVLQDEKMTEYKMSCRKGERICFGAEFPNQGGRRTYFGSSLSGQEGCENCCGECGAGPYGTQLVYKPSAEPAPTPANRNQGSVSNDAGLRNLGVAAGAAAAIFGLQQRQKAVQPTYRVAPPPAAPRGPSYRPSGISR
ncbi:hypothetical protein [Bosea sp. Root670]|uniref:hypothetical protein n=1 Tax=Bosea sp. Root670 TaxID=1736583 RepID=UPI000A8EDB72|nr:hypothetical protein [Bosea sp. Root670]